MVMVQRSLPTWPRVASSRSAYSLGSDAMRFGQELRHVAPVVPQLGLAAQRCRSAGRCGRAVALPNCIAGKCRAASRRNRAEAAARRILLFTLGAAHAHLPPLQACAAATVYVACDHSTGGRCRGILLLRPAMALCWLGKAKGRFTVDLADKGRCHPYGAGR